MVPNKFMIRAIMGSIDQVGLMVMIIKGYLVGLMVMIIKGYLVTWRKQWRVWPNGFKPLLAELGICGRIGCCQVDVLEVMKENPIILGLLC